MLSTRKWLFIVVLMLAGISVLVIGCGKQGSLNPLLPPEVFITSYEGVEDPASVDDPYYYQRRIYWRGESKGGVITGYAYRVLDIDEQPFEIPRSYIDENGWIYHYKPGADQSKPLTDPEVRTIWTNKVFDTINFPASVAGDSTNVTSIFDVKCIDNYDQESQIARRFFNVTSMVPDVDVIFSDRFRPLAAAGDTESPIYKTVGLGFEVEFEIKEYTPFIQPPNVPNYFMFRIEKRNVATGELISQKPEDNSWFSTRGQRQVRRMWLALEDDDPDDFYGRDDIFLALTPDEFHPNPDGQGPGDPITETLLIMKAVNMGGVQSVERTAKFRVYENFRPKALVYGRRTNVLGSNHFVPFQDASITRPLPEVQTPEGTHFGTPFFINQHGMYSALHSADLKIYLSWGWKGQFVSDDPDQGYINEVRDEASDIDYLAAVKAFDLRLDGQPYFYPPLMDDPQYEERYLQVDDDGTEWLRVPRLHEIDTRALLTNAQPGEHLFEVRVLDSQNRTSEPQEFSFLIEERIPRDQKHGVLIIDNDSYPPSGALALDEPTREFYEYVTSGAGEVPVLDRRNLRQTVYQSDLHYGRCVLSPTDLEPYKLIIWHSDDPTAVGTDNTNFHQEFEVVNLYMRGGGNILISAGQNLKNIHSESYNQPFQNDTLEKYFGIPYTELDAIRRISTSFQQSPFFVGANPDPTATLNLQSIVVNPEWHPVVNMFDAIGPIAYFNFDKIDDQYVKPIYRMAANESGEAFADVPVGVRRHSTANQGSNNLFVTNTTYLFGFPLSYMDREEVKHLMDTIFADIGI